MLYDQLSSHEIDHRIRHTFSLMNAISLSFNSSEHASHFFDLSRSHIRRTWPVTAIARPNVQLSTLGKRATTEGLFDHYKDTGVLKLREELGLTGRDIKVGIIDSGVDYTHPALGGCFGTGCRIAYGIDLVGDAYRGDNDPVPDNNPMDCNGHGTHVAGIIGGNDPEHHFTGVAPEVTFGVYRVFGCSGSSADDVIMKAMELAFNDGMDVINLSLGDIGWPDSPASVLADVLTLKGMIVCAAAGNEGEKGMFEVGSPSLGRHVLSVASTDNSATLAHPILKGNLSIGYTTSSGNPFTVTKAEIVPLSDTLHLKNDGCTPIKTKNLSGKVALIARGGCYFHQKMRNAQEAGAIAVLFYNNAPGLVTPSVTDPTIRIESGGVSSEQGELLFNFTKANPGIEYQFPQDDMVFRIPTAGAISSFSSWGLGPDLNLKPDLSAPGGHIYSTYPIVKGGYATLSGTSMASPHVAGLVALLQQAKGGSQRINPLKLRSSLISTSSPIEKLDIPGLESIARQGSGLIDAYKAIHASTLISPEQLALRDVSRAAPNNDYTFTIHNNGRMDADYSISHISATTVQGYDTKINMAPLQIPIQLFGEGAEAIIERITPSRLTIPANEAANVTVRIRSPITTAPSIYSGYFRIAKDSSPSDVLHLPYAGLSTNLSQLPVLHVNETMPSVLFNPYGISATSPALIRLQLLHASPLLLVTAVSASNTSEIYGIIPGGYWAFMGRNDINDVSDAVLMAWSGNIAIQILPQLLDFLL
ncbi:peptidase S8/S53 domain-containing protein [Dichotomocladium elegans]|nr:peptidase S8/S53 domain-containing protein [Dichotomocladium elegans]